MGAASTAPAPVQAAPAAGTASSSSAAAAPLSRPSWNLRKRPRDDINIMDFEANLSNEHRHIEEYIAQRVQPLATIDKGPRVPADGGRVPRLKWLIYECIAHSGRFDLHEQFIDAPDTTSDLPDGPGFDMADNSENSNSDSDFDAQADSSDSE